MKRPATHKLQHLLRRLHCDESGQIVPLFIFAALTLVFVVMLVLNTGRQIEQRIEVQNAADAAVITHASWIARSLNIISLNNTAITQAYATAVLATAWQQFKELMPGNAYERMALRSMRMIRGLESMNNRIVEEFPDFSAMVSTSLATRNGISDAPLFYAGFDHPRYFTGIRKHKETRFKSTALPVIATVGNPPYLCMTGEQGTPPAPNPDLNWNFQQYGYPLNEGPFITGRAHLTNRIPFIDFLKRMEFRNKANDLWSSGCVQSGIMIYQLANQPAATGPLGTSRDNWSVIAFTRSQTAEPVFPSKFPNPPGAFYGVAQAEIYNAVNYDLYTQDWHAKLVPARLLTGSQRGNTLQSILGISGRGGFPKLHELLSSISQDDMEQYIAH